VSAVALNITYYQSGVPLVLSPLSLSHADSDGNNTAEFPGFGRAISWKSIANVAFEGNPNEPEDVVRLGNNRFIVSGGQ